MREVETIKHAAVISDCGWIFMGKCHADCFAQMKNIGIKGSSLADSQGFITSKGNFARRKPAAHIAVRAGQVRPEVQILFSEDLWSPNSGGQFKYDSIVGYHR